MVQKIEGYETDRKSHGDREERKREEDEMG